MALFSPFRPTWRTEQNPFDVFDDHPFLNLNSSFFREFPRERVNRANAYETPKEYKLEIEVPGYQKSEISIEYGHDGKTIAVSGKTEKSYEEVHGEEEEEEEPRHVTVEDAPEPGEKATSEEPASQSTAVAETSKSKEIGAPAEPKYWVSERSVGSFTRTFTLPAGLDLGKATATLEHGVLTITIPKTDKVPVQKITIA
jgi:HSP20 family protein